MKYFGTWIEVEKNSQNFKENELKMWAKLFSVATKNLR